MYWYGAEINYIKIVVITQAYSLSRRWYDSAMPTQICLKLENRSTLDIYDAVETSKIFYVWFDYWDEHPWTSRRSMSAAVARTRSIQTLFRRKHSLARWCVRCPACQTNSVELSASVTEENDVWFQNHCLACFQLVSFFIGFSIFRLSKMTHTDTENLIMLQYFHTAKQDKSA